MSAGSSRDRIFAVLEAMRNDVDAGVIDLHDDACLYDIADAALLAVFA